MKTKSILHVFLVSLMFVVLTSCAITKVEVADPWDEAVYTADTEFGAGEKTINVEVVVNEHSVNFTINTDKETLGDAMVEYELLSGEPGPYGLYVKKVNGIVADYDINKCYWSLTKNGEYMNTGVDGTNIQGGEKFELTYMTE